MDITSDQAFLSEIEAKAVEMARHSGELLHGYFGTDLEVEYKDEKRRWHPVTRADRESQEYLSDSISRSFPDHGIVGEEGADGEEGETAKDMLWVLDPLDGTTNFINGLPIYAVSIGVLHRGAPIVGALFVPWPGKAQGAVLHARRGGGARLDGDTLSLRTADLSSEGPEANGLVGVPGSFGGRFKVGKGLRGRLGDPRVTGSAAYELAMAASGVFQYIVLGAPRVWDLAAGAVIIPEAGGAVMVKSGKARRWESLTSVGPSWDQGRPTVKELRNWAAPIVAGNEGVVSVVAANLGKRRRPVSAKVGRLLGRLGRKRS